MSDESHPGPRPGPYHRLALTAVLALAAVALSFRAARFDMLTAYRQTLLLTDTGAGIVLDDSGWGDRSPEARLILGGAPAASTPVARQRAIWTRWPTNRVYFHNTLSAALAYYPALGTNDAARYRALRALVEEGRPLDPNNARLNWILAAKLLDQACTFKTTLGNPARTPGTTVRSEMEVRDRAKLEEAMRLLNRGLAQPTYRRYAREMLAEREALLGPARTFPDLVQRLVVAATTPLPDVTVQRNLARGATAYGGLLIAEGHPREALPYLNAWKPLGLQLNEDAFTLVDMLVVGAIFKEADARAPQLVRTVAGAAEADRMSAAIALLTRPIREWKAKRDRLGTLPAPAGTADLPDHSGILLAMLLRGIGVTPTEAELAPSRLLDYLLLEHAYLLGTALVLSVALVAATLLGLSLWRRAEAELPGPAETWRAAARAVGAGVLIPLAAYALLAWGTPFGGRHYGLTFAWPKATLQAGLAAAVLLMLLQRRIARQAAASAVEADPASAGLARLGRRLLTWALLVGAALSLFPTRWLSLSSSVGAVLASFPLVLILLWATGSGALAVWTARRGPTRPPARLARLTAFAVPTLALAVLVLNLGARGILSWKERRLVARDTLIQVDADMGGFTTTEARVARELRDGVLQAAALLENRPAVIRSKRR